jgi:hypothetical protein
MVLAVLGTSGITAGLVALADDAQGAVSPLEAEVLDVRRARLAHPQAVEAQQDGQGGVGVVNPLGREQELPELGAVESAGVAGVDLGSANVLSRVRGDTAVDVGEAVEAADRREPAVDGGGSQATSLHGPRVQLDLWPGGRQDVEAVVGRPLEERPQVMAVGLQRALPVAAQERSGSQFGFVDRSVRLGGALDLRHGHQFGWNLPESVRSPANLLAEGRAHPRRWGIPMCRLRTGRSGTPGDAARGAPDRRIPTLWRRPS